MLANLGMVQHNIFMVLTQPNIAALQINWFCFAKNNTVFRVLFNSLSPKKFIWITYIDNSSDTGWVFI